MPAKIPAPKKYKVKNVFVHGELWKASCESPLEKEQVVSVESIDGVSIKVRPIKIKIT